MIDQGKDHVALASDYDTFVNWDARLARELPFFLRHFAEAGANHVVDVGAGSAKLSVAFGLEGLKVDAVDPDDSMLAAAGTNIADAAERITEAGGSVRLQRGGFGELRALGIADADALICTGNALPHSSGPAGLREALADFSAVLRPGAVLVLHLLNHDRLLASHTRALSPMVRDGAHGMRVYLRVLDWAPDDCAFEMNFLTLEKHGGDAEGSWDVASYGGTHTVMTPATVAAELEVAGFERIELLGGHDGHALTAADESVIVVARKR